MCRSSGQRGRGPPSWARIILSGSSLAEGAASTQGVPTRESQTDLWFTDHAKRRMLRRHITEDFIRQVIADPDHTTDRPDGCTEYVALVQDGIRHRWIEVVLDETTEPRSVVTVYEPEGEWQ